jgi:hypothetical protein
MREWNTQMTASSALRPSPVRRAAVCLGALSLPVLFLAGCGGGSEAPTSLTLYPVKGKVLLEDGKPLTAGRIVFVATQGNIAPNGTIGSGGEFTLSSGPAGEGAPAGEYKVRIDPEITGGGQGKVKKGARFPFGLHYTDEDSSGLTATVKPEPNDLPPFKLSAKDSVPAKGGRVKD